MAEESLERAADPWISKRARLAAYAQASAHIPKVSKVDFENVKKL